MQRVYAFEYIYNKIGPPDAYPDATVFQTDIADLTENLIGSADEDTRDDAKTELADKGGWKVNLNKSEELLSEVTTFEGIFMVTTFEPNSAPTATGEPDPCNFSTTGRLYIMHILDARPIQIVPDGSEITAGLEKQHRVTMRSRLVLFLFLPNQRSI